MDPTVQIALIGGAVVLIPQLINMFLTVRASNLSNLRGAETHASLNSLKSAVDGQNEKLNSMTAVASKAEGEAVGIAKERAHPQQDAPRIQIEPDPLKVGILPQKKTPPRTPSRKR